MNPEPAEFMPNIVPNANECAVCYTEVEDDSNKYTLECNHTFHTDCAIQWFRRGNSTCPLCRRGNPYVDMSSLYCNFCPDIYKCHMSSKNWEYAKFTYMKMVIRNKSAPKDLINRFNKYDKIIKKQKEYTDILSKWRKSPEYKAYMKARTTSRKLQSKLYSTRRKLHEIKMQICAYPLIPYRFNPNVLPTKKQKQPLVTSRPSTRSQTRINS